METKTNTKKVDNKRKIQNKSTKKLNVEMNKKGFIQRVVELYFKELNLMTIIFAVIGIVLFVIAFYSGIKEFNSSEGLYEGVYWTPFVDQIKEMGLLYALVIFAGVTPYVPIPILGVFQALTLPGDMIIRYALGGSSYVGLFIGGIIQTIAIAICTAVGMRYWRMTTKKNKYYHKEDFSLRKIKMQVYEIRKDQAKLDEMNRQDAERAKKIEESNIKIPYLEFISLGAVSFVIGFIGLLITKI